MMPAVYLLFYVLCDGPGGACAARPLEIYPTAEACLAAAADKHDSNGWPAVMATCTRRA